MYRTEGYVRLSADQMPADINAFNPTSIAALMRGYLSPDGVYFHKSNNYNPDIVAYKKSGGFLSPITGGDEYAIAFRMDSHSLMPAQDVEQKVLRALGRALVQLQARLSSPDAVLAAMSSGDSRGAFGAVRTIPIDRATAEAPGRVSLNSMPRPAQGNTPSIADYDGRTWFSSSSLASVDFQNRGMLDDAELTQPAPPQQNLPTGQTPIPTPTPVPAPSGGKDLLTSSTAGDLALPLAVGGLVVAIGLFVISRRKTASVEVVSNPSKRGSPSRGYARKRS